MARLIETPWEIKIDGYDGAVDDGEERRVLVTYNGEVLEGIDSINVSIKAGGVASATIGVTMPMVRAFLSEANMKLIDISTDEEKKKWAEFKKKRDKREEIYKLR